MKRTIPTTALLLALGLCLAAVAAHAETRTGRARSNRDLVWAFVPITSGQAVATLTWKTSSAELFTVLTCGEDESDQVIWGVGAGFMDRVQRIESGVVEGLLCFVTVASSRGSSNFALNLQVTADEPLVRASSAPSVATGALLTPVDLDGLPALRDSIDRVRALRRASR